MSCVLAKEIISRFFKLGTFLLLGHKILQRTSPWLQGITKKFLWENLGLRRMHRAALIHLGVSTMQYMWRFWVWLLKIVESR